MKTLLSLLLFFQPVTVQVPQQTVVVPAQSVPVSIPTQPVPDLSGFTKNICSGTITLGTLPIASGGLATTVMAPCKGLLTTDVISVSSSVGIFGVFGYQPSVNGILSINVYPTVDTVNASVANNTLKSITPSALVLNYHVTR